LVIAAHLYSASWWQTICYTFTTALIALLFCSVGLYGALSSLTLKRADKWFERLGLFCGFAGGATLIILGLVGAWMFFRSAVLGL
jgi:hypothetical protein